MSSGFSVKVWSKTLPGRNHPERNEDALWSARNGVVHAVIDGMGGSRRLVEGSEIGGEHATAAIVAALDDRLQNLPQSLSIRDARELLSVTVAEAGRHAFHDVNASGLIPPEQIPEGKIAEDVMAAAVLTAVVFCEGGRRAVISQNGDTRCYLYSDGDLVPLTDDQDAVLADMERGVLAEEDALSIGEELDSFDGHDLGRLSPMARRYYAQRYLVFGQLGDSDGPPSPTFTTIQLASGDYLVLVSDGVHDNLSKSEIAAALQSIDPAAALVDRADARSLMHTLPNPSDLDQEYNYRAHQDDATAVVVMIEW